jgi:hypothetical protein
MSTIEERARKLLRDVSSAGCSEPKCYACRRNIENAVAAIRAERDAAIEECAAECERVSESPYNCAAAIRALRSKP